jgi:chromosome segregation ATPase
LSQAEEAMFNNEDQSAVSALVEAIRSAQDKVDTKENAMIRAQEHFHLLEQEYFKLEEDRNAIETERLNGQIGEKETELEGKDETLRVAKEAKTTWDNRKQELQDEVARLNADSGATEEQKTQAQTDLDGHNASETTVTDAVTTALTERDNLDEEIKQDAKTREDNEYLAEKNKRDAKFYDLESQKMDEESQLATLEEQLQNWKRKRAEATLEDNDDKFDEMHAQVLKA